MYFASTILLVVWICGYHLGVLDGSVCDHHSYKYTNTKNPANTVDGWNPIPNHRLDGAETRSK